MENLCRECKLDSRNALPIVLAALGTDPRRLGRNKVRRTIAVVMEVVREMRQKISSVNVFYLARLAVQTYRKMRHASVKSVLNPP